MEAMRAPKMIQAVTNAGTRGRGRGDSTDLVAHLVDGAGVDARRADPRARGAARSRAARCALLLGVQRGELLWERCPVLVLARGVRPEARASVRPARRVSVQVREIYLCVCARARRQRSTEPPWPNGFSKSRWATGFEARAQGRPSAGRRVGQSIN